MKGVCTVKTCGNLLQDASAWILLCDPNGLPTRYHLCRSHHEYLQMYSDYYLVKTIDHETIQLMGVPILN